MNAQKLVKNTSLFYVGLSTLSLAYVALLSMYSPQATMDLVATPLPNTDAISSIRGIYGGVGIVITIQLVYLLIKDIHKGLVFLSMFWGSYALSRLITGWVEGPLGAFGSQWLIVETSFSLLAIVLLLLSKKSNKVTTNV